MRLLLLICALVFCFHSLGAVNITVATQAEWEAVPDPLAFGDTVFISSGGEAIVNIMPRNILGTIINDGDFTMNLVGSQISMMGSFINNGNFTLLGFAGLSIFGEFVNTGELNISMSPIVIQPGGSLINTGSVTNSIDIANNGILASCNPIAGNTPSGLGLNGNVPVGTPCNDGDDATSNDMIVDDSCTCIGEAAIPTMGQWMLFILGLMLTSVAIVVIKKSRIATV